METKLFTFFST